MFDEWCDPPGIEILRRVDRRVIVDTHKIWVGYHFKPERTNSEGVQPYSPPPFEVRRHGLKINSLQEGRQVAWIRRTSGEYLGLVLIEVGSGDGASRLTMGLWLEAGVFRLPRADGS